MPAPWVPLGERGNLPGLDLWGNVVRMHLEKAQTRRRKRAAAIVASTAIAVSGLVAVVPASTASATNVRPDSANHAMGSWAGGPQARVTSDGRSTSWLEQGVTGRCGIDISYWDHQSPGVLDLNQLHSACAEFVFIKASEFSSGREGYSRYTFYETDKAAAKAAGMVIGAYQYAKPTADTAQIVADATAQAQGLIALTGPIRAGELPPVLDLEDAPSALGKSNLTLWAKTWLATAQQLTGRTPILYTYTNFMTTRLVADPDLVKYPLWQAHYYYKLTAPTAVAGWPIENRLFWQFTSAGQLPGTGGTATDLDVLMGTDDQYRNLIQTGTLPPQLPKPPTGRALYKAVGGLARIEAALAKNSRRRQAGYAHLWPKWAGLLGRGVAKQDLRYGSQHNLGRPNRSYVVLREVYSQGDLCAVALGQVVNAPWKTVSCPPRMRWSSF